MEFRLKASSYHELTRADYDSFRALGMHLKPVNERDILDVPFFDCEETLPLLVDIPSIEDLKRISDITGHELILNFSGKDGPFVEIYNNYRECRIVKGTP